MKNYVCHVIWASWLCPNKFPASLELEASGLVKLARLCLARHLGYDSLLHLARPPSWCQVTPLRSFHIQHSIKLVLFQYKVSLKVVQYDNINNCIRVLDQLDFSS